MRQMKPTPKNLETKTEIINGQEVVVKVYAYHEPKKVTAKPKSKHPMIDYIRSEKKKRKGKKGKKGAKR